MESETLHCPYCGDELVRCDTFPKDSPAVYYECRNDNECPHAYEVMHESVWEDLAVGLKAKNTIDKIQRELKKPLDNCILSSLAALGAVQQLRDFFKEAIGYDDTQED